MPKSCVEALDVIHSNVHPYTLNGGKKVQRSVHVISCILNRSLDTKAQIIDDIQVWWLSRPSHAMNFIISNWLEFTYYARPVNSDILISLAKWRAKRCQRWLSKMSLYYVAFLLPSTMHKVLTACSVINPHIIADAFTWVMWRTHAFRSVRLGWSGYKYFPNYSMWCITDYYLILLYLCRSSFPLIFSRTTFFYDICFVQKKCCTVFRWTALPSSFIEIIGNFPQKPYYYFVLSFSTT